MFLLYTVVGNNIALHRYYSHDEFEVGPVVKKLFAWLTLTLSIGSPASYASLHITHHIYPTSGPDWTWRSLPFYRHIWFNKDTIQPYIGKRVVQLYREHPLIHDYNLLLIAVYAVALYLISYKLFLFFWFIPVTVSMWTGKNLVIIPYVPKGWEPSKRQAMNVRSAERATIRLVNARTHARRQS
jgi:fatty-acid desaturase